MNRTTIALALGILLGACTSRSEQPAPANDLWSQARPALASITAADLLNHIKVLASDEFEGRAPGSHGEELTVAYLTDQFKKYGLQPGNPDGSFVQAVPMVGFTAHPSASITAGGQTIAMSFPEDYVAISRHFQPQVDVDASDIVFVGYGIVAPEYNWDDYKDVDVRGKTILMLVNDPNTPDTALFRGKGMTYYGRWTYKYEIAAAKGAAAAIIIHETGPAGYPYEVLSGSWGHENFDIKPSGPSTRANVEAWITLPKAKQLLTATGYDYEQLKQMASRRDFRPIALHAQATFHLQNTLRDVNSRNVVARLQGSKHPDEYIIYTAHWDHLGRDVNKPGDQIYNGANDNASGVASLLALAKAYSKLPQRPDRSILFLSVTSEEQGLLGSKYYASNPLYPLDKTLAVINMDGMNQWGRTKDVVLVGKGYSTLDDVTAALAASQGGRVVAPDPEPEKGFFFRSDHFEFAKVGVPALDPKAGELYVGKPAGYGQQKRDEYTKNDYHKPTDEVKPDWDLSGDVEDTQLYFMIGYQVAQSDKWPEWKAGSEFKRR